MTRATSGTRRSPGCWFCMGEPPRMPAQNPPAPSVTRRQAVLNPLILRKSSAQARVEGMIPDIWGENDFSVIEGSACVGRIYREWRDGEWQWRWLLHSQPPAPNQGMADTLEEATIAFKRRYEEAKGGA
jgi:hypothetical protein